MKKKQRWLAGYESFLDWYIVPETDEYTRLYADSDGDVYDSFSSAKKALINRLKQRISADRSTLKDIRHTKKKDR